MSDNICGKETLPTLSTPTFPLVPFLLTSIEKEGDKRHFVIDAWDGDTIDIDNNGQFTQTFMWKAHKATEEEIEKFMREEDE